MANMINLTIDGIQTQIEAGSTILQAAEQVGRTRPKYGSYLP